MGRRDRESHDGAAVWTGSYFESSPDQLSTLAHELQSEVPPAAQRDRWHVETYLLAIGLVFVVTLLVGGACLPWAVPEFSFVRALAEGFANAQGLYTTLVQRLFL